MNYDAASKINVKFAEIRSNMEKLVEAGLMEKMVNVIGKTKINMIEIMCDLMEEIERKEKLENVPEEVIQFYNNMMEQYNEFAGCVKIEAVKEKVVKEKQEKAIKPRKKEAKKEEVKKEPEVVVKKEKVVKEKKEKAVKEKKDTTTDKVDYTLLVYNKWLNEGKQPYNTDMAKRFYSELELEDKITFSYVHHMLYYFDKKGKVPKAARA